MPKSLGSVVNAGLKSIGDTEVTEFTATNILQQLLIEEANNAVRDILSRNRYRWGLKRTILETTAKVSSTSTADAALTNGSPTVTSKDGSGGDDDNFGSVTTSMYGRFASDNTSYKVTAVDTDSSPDTATLEADYKGTTSTGAAYTFLQDEYAFADSDFGELKHLTFGEGASGTYAGRIADQVVHVVDLSEIIRQSGGDLHRDSSGKPMMIARIGVDSSDNPLFKLWPYPGSAYLMDAWYVPFFSENTTFGTSLFGGDAPELAYDAVEYRVVGRAHLYEKQYQEVKYWEDRYQVAVLNLIRGPTTLVDQSIDIETYRRTMNVGFRAESQIIFDRA